jgi:integrative and conjugative element protein (TIGR02256 family)
MPNMSTRRCWIERSALGSLVSEARRWRVRETGGALLGWRDGEETVVMRVLGPGPAARHGWSSFEPDTKWQLEQGRRIYAESARTIAFLGDWHTHPLGVPKPSTQDRRTAEMLAEDEAFRTPVPLYAIAGRRSGQISLGRLWRLVIYEWHGDNGLEPVEVVPFNQGTNLG